MLDKASNAPMGKKYCPCCDRTRAVSFFPTHGGKPAAYCKPCGREMNHKANIKRKYGLTPEQYDLIYVTQGGKCAICQIATGKTKKLAVDHDHKTGKVRGLLCSTCNRMILGTLRDDITALQRAIDYLITPPAQIALGVDVPIVENHVSSHRLKRPLPDGDLRRIVD
jgi:hypothetical protein